MGQGPRCSVEAHVRCHELQCHGLCPLTFAPRPPCTPSPQRIPTPFACHPSGCTVCSFAYIAALPDEFGWQSDAHPDEAAVGEALDVFLAECEWGESVCSCVDGVASEQCSWRKQWRESCGESSTFAGSIFGGWIWDAVYAPCVLSFEEAF